MRGLLWPPYSPARLRTLRATSPRPRAAKASLAPSRGKRRVISSSSFSLPALYRPGSPGKARGGRGGAVERADDRLLLDQGAGVDRNGRVQGRVPHPDGDAALARAEDALHEGRLHQPDGLEGVVDAGAARQLADALDGVLLRGVDRMRRAEAARHRKLVVQLVDRHDHARAGDDGALDAVEADAAAAKDADGSARLDAGRVDHGADARRDAAADQRRLLGGGGLVARAG